MKFLLRRLAGPRYAFVVVALTFVSLLTAAALRSAPGVLIVPWQKAFGWDRGTISLAAAIGIFLYGLVGPFAAALMQTLGVRKTLVGALMLMAASTLASAFMTQPWQLIATWGVFSGVASGCVAMVLGATIVNRWFVQKQGLMMGLLTASTATGTLIFLPGMAAIAQAGGWKPVVLTIAAVAAVLAPVMWLLMPERPAEVGLMPYGADPATHVEPPAPGGDPLRRALSALATAARTKDFWLLGGTFFICGFTTNGLIGTHMISLCADHGLPEVKAAGLLAMMGLFDLIGTTGSGWLSDRVDPRKLLFAYYGLRGLSLIYLAYANFTFYGLSIFAVFYGLDWIATVPPTLKLANRAFGPDLAPIVFGWIAAGHQLGAATAAFMAGTLRTIEGRYLEALVLAGSAAIVAAVLSLLIGRGAREAGPVLAPA